MKKLPKAVLAGLGILAGYEIHEYSKVYGGISYRPVSLGLVNITPTRVDVQSVIEVTNASSRNVTLNSVDVLFSYKGTAFASMRKNAGTGIAIPPGKKTSFTVNFVISNQRAIAALTSIATNPSPIIHAAYKLRFTAKLLTIPVPVWVRQTVGVSLSSYVSKFKDVYKQLGAVVESFKNFLDALNSGKGNGSSNGQDVDQLLGR